MTPKMMCGIEMVTRVDVGLLEVKKLIMFLLSKGTSLILKL